MSLTEAEREHKISEFLDRKLKEFDLDDEPLYHVVRPLEPRA